MKKSLRITIITGSTLAVLAMALFIAGPERNRLTEDIRRASGSEFIQLSEGYTEYEIAGPADGIPVVLIHGFSVAFYDWDEQFQVLADAGFRVLRYNHYARGLSDRPRGRYGMDRYVGQLLEMIEAQGWDSANLVVHSMGGAVASAFASSHPEMVQSTVLISPIRHMAEDNAGITLTRIPIVGDLAAKVVLFPIIAERARKLFVRSGVSDLEAYQVEFREQARYFGFTRAVKSLFRGNMVDDLEPYYRQMDGSRCLLIWGTDDASVSEDHIDSVISFIPGMDVEILPGAGHSPNLEVPETVNLLILDFLNGA